MMERLTEVCTYVGPFFCAHSYVQFSAVSGAEYKRQVSECRGAQLNEELLGLVRIVSTSLHRYLLAACTACCLLLQIFKLRITILYWYCYKVTEDSGLSSYSRRGFLQGGSYTSFGLCIVSMDHFSCSASDREEPFYQALKHQHRLRELTLSYLD